MNLIIEKLSPDLLHQARLWGAEACPSWGWTCARAPSTRHAMWSRGRRRWSRRSRGRGRWSKPPGIPSKIFLVYLLLFMILHGCGFDWCLKAKISDWYHISYHISRLWYQPFPRRQCLCKGLHRRPTRRWSGRWSSSTWSQQDPLQEVNWWMIIRQACLSHRQIVILICICKTQNISTNNETGMLSKW